MNKRNIVNIGDESRTSVERELMWKLRGLLGEISWLPESRWEARQNRSDPGPDVVVQLGSGHGSLHVEVKANLRPNQFQALANECRLRPGVKGAVPVLAVPVATHRLAELCRREGWSWFDLSGNCWIDVPGLLRIERSGNKSTYRRPRARANLGSAEAARLMRVLLTPAHANFVWRQRDLQASTGSESLQLRPVSLGLVSKVVRHLVEQDYLASTEEGFRLKDPVGLLAAWRQAYRFDRHQRLGFFTMLRGTGLEKALTAVGRESGHMAALASFSAAERQSPYVTEPRTWVYIAHPFLDLLIERTGARAVDSGENLVVLIPDDMGVFASFPEGKMSPPGDGPIPCTDPAQTYVDLMHSHGRGEEAAGALMERRLLPAWKGAGLV